MRMDSWHGCPEAKQGMCALPDQERDAQRGTRSFILKRNLSNAAAHVLTLVLPDWMLAAGCLMCADCARTGNETSPSGSVHSSGSAQPCWRGDSPWRAAPMMAQPPGLFTGVLDLQELSSSACPVLHGHAEEECGAGAAVLRCWHVNSMHAAISGACRRSGHAAVPAGGRGGAGARVLRRALAAAAQGRGHGKAGVPVRFQYWLHLKAPCVAGHSPSSSRTHMRTS